jgi:prevent-host-death family protein
VDLVFALVYNGLVNVNIHQAKTHLSRLLDRVALGEEIVIAKAGKPVARLVPVERPAVKRVLGTAKGDFVVPDDFDAPLPEEVLAEFFK